MDEKDIDLLLRQVKSVILNRPLMQDQRCEADELQDLQDAISYLSGCLAESNMFLRELCSGNLNIVPPSRHNFLSGYLKELHSILKHLTWQTTQVANGDYRQTIHFLGEFSDSFNKMVAQLQEREVGLKAKTEALSQSMDLIASLMDHLQDWVIVLDAGNDDFLFINRTARERFYNPDTGMTFCGKRCLLLEDLIKNKEFITEIPEYACRRRKVVLSVKSYPLEWKGRKAYAFYISDITNQAEEIENLQNMAYTDVLTGLNNRRYCMEQLNTLLKDHHPFSLVLLDLDGLKYVNDNFGHVSGDEYLQTIAHLISQHFSGEQDICCRIGGDEFVLIIPDRTKAEVEAEMKKIHHAVTTLERSYRLSVSYGIIYINAVNYKDPDVLLSQADETMYKMKIKNRRERK